MSQAFTIQEVSQKLQVSKHTLRFWEKELAGIIVPLRTRGGQRRYTPDHLFILEEIKRLKGQGFSLAKINETLSGGRSLRRPSLSSPKRIERLADEVAEVVRSAVYDYLRGVKAKE